MSLVYREDDWKAAVEIVRICLMMNTPGLN